jgi:hypothetical protein
MSNVLGNISFQANNKMDVFYVAQVEKAGLEPAFATLQIDDLQFESDKSWVTGNVPRIKPVHVEGDTSIINAWFKGETFDDPFIITVYVECETAEELEEVRADEEIEQDKRSRNDFLEPVEINL